MQFFSSAKHCICRYLLASSLRWQIYCKSYSQEQNNNLIFVKTFIYMAQFKIKSIKIKTMDNKQKTALEEIETEMKNDVEFQAFQRKLTTYNSSESIINDLNDNLSKKKATLLGEKLFKELSQTKVSEAKSGIWKEIQKSIEDQKQFQVFQKSIGSFKTVQDVIDALNDCMGKKKAQALGQRFFKQEIQPKLKGKGKSECMQEIEKLIDDESDIKQFQCKLPAFRSSSQLIAELSNLIGKKPAQRLGDQLYREELQGNRKSNRPFNISKSNAKKNESSVLDQIEKEIDDDKLFKRFKLTMNNNDLVEDLADDLSAYMGKLKAKAFAERLFKETGKDRIVVNKIEYLYQELKQKNIDGKTISDVRHLVTNGKKKTVRRVLVQILGPVGGKQLYERFKDQIVERQSQPVKGSKFVKVQNDLQIYEYKDTLLPFEEASAKTIIVLGETGCGKSTFLNAVVNYLAEVEMEDPFRYKVIIENQEHQTASITNKITSYYIKNPRTSMFYRLIDTPGFGDTKGIEMDFKIVDMVKQTITKQIDSIHNILFLMKASTTRITHYQQYVFQSIMDLFNKDIAPNFVFIFTFSDSGKPQVLPAVMDPLYGFGNYWNQIAEPKYLQVNNCGIFEKIGENETIKLGYWEIGMTCMKNLFEKIHTITPRSLNMSRDLLRKKDSLSNKMKVTQQKIQNAIAQRQNLCKQIEKVIQFQQQIDSNKDFTYNVDVIKYYNESTNYNVTRCMNCVDSNCHENCCFGDGQDKINCCAFTNGYCQVCPGKCHWNVHRNDHNLRKAKTVQQKRENSVNKSNYETSCQNLKTSEALISNLINDLQQVFKTVQEATNQMIEIQKDLLKNQMSKKKPESTISYLTHLIANQEREQKPGYTGKVNQMNLIIKDMKFYEQLASGNKTKEEIINQIKGYQLHQIKKLLQKAPKGFFQKIKDFFSFN